MDAYLYLSNEYKDFETKKASQIEAFEFNNS